jgi:hypothetical protein
MAMPTKVTARNKAYFTCLYVIVGLTDQWGGIVKELCLGMRMVMVLGLFILLCINDLPDTQPGMKATWLA